MQQLPAPAGSISPGADAAAPSQGRGSRARLHHSAGERPDQLDGGQGVQVPRGRGGSHFMPHRGSCAGRRGAAGEALTAARAAGAAERRNVDVPGTPGPFPPVEGSTGSGAGPGNARTSPSGIREICPAPWSTRSFQGRIGKEGASQSDDVRRAGVRSGHAGREGGGQGRATAGGAAGAEGRKQAESAGHRHGPCPGTGSRVTRSLGGCGNTREGTRRSGSPRSCTTWTLKRCGRRSTGQNPTPLPEPAGSRGRCTGPT